MYMKCIIYIDVYEMHHKHRCIWNASFCARECDTCLRTRPSAIRDTQTYVPIDEFVSKFGTGSHEQNNQKLPIIHVPASMYVCMYVCMYAHKQATTRSCPSCTHLPICMCVCVCAGMCMHVGTHKMVFDDMKDAIHVFVYVCVYACISQYVVRWVYACMYLNM